MESTMTDWLGVVDKYYLSDFIESGGSAFKLVLTHGKQSVPIVLDKIQALAESQGYIYVGVSATETRIDRIDQLFFAVARQIDWNTMIAMDAVNFLRGRDYEIPESIEPGNTVAIAEANGCDQEDLLKDIRRATKQEITRDRRMCKEFRTAISQLRSALFFPRNVTPSDAETLSGWMRGEKVSAAALRDLRIYSKIGRHNAREMLIALAHWLAKSVGMGLVIGLDLRGLLHIGPSDTSDNPSLRYSRAALLDSYEVIRQFIDETDEITHCLICAVAPSDIVTDEKKSIFKYYALQSRLLSEVHDVECQNMLAAMVHVGDAGIERTLSDE
ncbi:MAG: BREX system ATP-binding domain-containing protein [Armatimonadota bacterium]